MIFTVLGKCVEYGMNYILNIEIEISYNIESLKKAQLKRTTALRRETKKNEK